MCHFGRPHVLFHLFVCVWVFMHSHSGRVSVGVSLFAVFDFLRQEVDFYEADSPWNLLTNEPPNVSSETRYTLHKNCKLHFPGSSFWSFYIQLKKSQVFESLYVIHFTSRFEVLSHVQKYILGICWLAIILLSIVNDTCRKSLDVVIVPSSKTIFIGMLRKYVHSTGVLMLGW
jgi:hypothetical protein